MVRGVVLSSLAKRPAGDQATEHRDGEAVRVVECITGEQPSGQDDRGDHGEGHGHVGAHVECLGERLRVGGVSALHEEGADDRGDHPHQGDGHREHEERDRHLLGGVLGGQAAGEGDQRDRSQNRPGIRFEEVGAHAGDIPNVVANVVGDGGRVAGVVLRYARLDLADQVGTDVSGLRVDAATNPAEQGDRAGTEAIGSHDFERLVDLEDEHEHDVDEHQPGKGQARHTEAHDCSTSKGHRESFSGTVLRCVGGSGVGHRGDGHARIAGGRR